MYKKNVLWHILFYCGAKNASAIAPGPTWVPIAAPTETIGNSSLCVPFPKAYDYPRYTCDQLIRKPGIS